ncbi:hypothetical protein ABW19_dt0200258 [Dactylella cylindrospora]|nr:hypothetical protein ABW19_dt0200258 [Dactylella cylindrospora]
MQELLEPTKALPIINVDGVASLPTEVIEDVPKFTFSKPASPIPGVYDLVLDGGLFLAVFEDGTVGFVPESSNGQAFVVGPGGKKYITTIFSVFCTGEVKAGILGQYQFIFTSVDNKVLVTNLVLTKARLRRDIEVPKGFFVLPKPVENPLNGQRCLGQSQTAVTKNPPVPITSNGCGTDDGIGYYVPEYKFHDCCNGHDVCFSTCSEDLQSCNQQMYQCTVGKCREAYPSQSGLGWWACNKAANQYSWGVNTETARKQFVKSSETYCDCKCNDPKLTACQEKCVDVLNDPDNCGQCYFKCPSGGCKNGACAFNSCVGQTCSNFGPCGPGGTCVCASITDGTGFCVNGQTPCAGLADCGTSADCPVGSVCAVGSCCGRNVCITTDTCGGFNTPTRLLFGRNWIGATIADKGVWVPGSG